MNHHYKIAVQFADSKASFNQVAQTEVKKAIDNYNKRSLIARNKKEIIGYSFPNELTLELELKSEAALDNPTRALRLLSEYLVKQTTLGDYVSGKQLFKMAVKEETKENKGAASDFRTLLPEEREEVVFNLLCAIKNELKEIKLCLASQQA